MGNGKFLVLAGVIGTALALVGSAASAAPLLYSNLGPGGTYDCCDSWNVDNVNTPAMNFVASASGEVSQIDVALQRGTAPGPSAATVSLWTDNSGLLGDLLGSWSVSNFPAFGSSTSALTTITGIVGINITAGESYFLQVAPEGAPAAWNFNTVGATGPALENGVPVGENERLGAFDILAASVPEPNTWAMLILGVGLIGSAARRRSAGVAARGLT